VQYEEKALPKGSSLTVKGEVSLAYDSGDGWVFGTPAKLPAQTLPPDYAFDNTYWYTTPQNFVFPDRVGDDYLTVYWQASTDGGKTWENAGSTTNVFYVTFKDPSVELFETAVSYGSASSAKNLADLFQGIWKNNFTSQQLKRADGKALTYYANWTNEPRTAAQLLLKGESECGGFAQLLWYSIGSQGLLTALNVSEKDVQALYPTVFNAGTKNQVERPESFLVNDWHFFATNGSKGTAYPWVDKQPGNDVSVQKDGRWQYTWTGPVSYLGARTHKGQNNDNPAAAFGRHYIIGVTLPGAIGQFYDPSYGVTYTGEMSFQETAVAGFYNYVPNGPPWSVLVRKPDPKELEIKFLKFL
jgi:hypothetical protein